MEVATGRQAPPAESPLGTWVQEQRTRLERADRVSADLPLLAGWVALGIGSTLYASLYSPLGVFLLTCGTGLLVLTLAAGLRPAPGWSRTAGVALAVAVVVLAACMFPAGIFATGPWLATTRLATTIGGVAVAIWVLFRMPERRGTGYLLVALFAASGTAMILASPTPTIDVWYMLQSGAHALTHGHNIYTITYVHILGEVRNQFVYLPGAAILAWPFHVLFGDVRYAVLVAMVATALILIRVGGSELPSYVPALVVLYPATTFGLEQSWIDPIVLAALCGAVYAARRGRTGWAVALFALCLVTKQSAWLFIPLAAVWPPLGWRRTTIAALAAVAVMAPFVLADPHAFYEGAIASNLNLPVRLTGMSLYTTALLHGWNPTIVFTGGATLAAIGLSLWQAPRTAYGFLLGSAVVMAVFDLTNKQSPYNWWAFAAELTFAAFVFGAAEARGDDLGQRPPKAVVSA